MLNVGDTTSPTGAHVSRRQRGADVYLHDVVGSVLGVVRFSVTDVAMPTHDVPITVTRHYDSTDRRRGDFGYGWRLEESESSVQVSRPLGEGIAIWSRQGPFAFPCTDVFEQKQHSRRERLWCADGDELRGHDERDDHAERADAGGRVGPLPGRVAR